MREYTYYTTVKKTMVIEAETIEQAKEIVARWKDDRHSEGAIVAAAELIRATDVEDKRT